jgi:hypothetical protein
VLSTSAWKTEYQKELEQAISAGAAGKEGMARVCARRAAGIVIGEYLLRRGYIKPGPSAYDRLSLFNSLPDVDNQLKIIASHFLLKVNIDRSLPINADLVSEVQWLMEQLIGESG